MPSPKVTPTAKGTAIRMTGMSRRLKSQLASLPHDLGFDSPSKLESAIRKARADLGLGETLDHGRIHLK